MRLEQETTQVSCIEILGGDNVLVNNTFTKHRNAFDNLILTHAPNIYNFMPESYFHFSQAPLIGIFYNDPRLAITVDFN